MCINRESWGGYHDVYFELGRAQEVSTPILFHERRSDETCGHRKGSVRTIAGLHVTIAQAQSRVASSKQIYKADLNVRDGKEVVITRIDASPGTNYWHYHPGDSFTYVMEGAQVRETDEGKAQFDAGTVFHDKPQQIHRSENSGPVKLLVVRVLEKGLPETIPIR